MGATRYSERNSAGASPPDAAPLWRRTRAISSRLRLAAAIDWRRAPLWAPVAFGTGVAAFFEAPFEPRLIDAAWAVAGALLLLAASRRMGAVATLAAAAALLAALGVASGAVRARVVAAPVLAKADEHLVEGRLRAISSSGSGAPRLLFDQVEIEGLDAPPARVRVTAAGAPLGGLRPGDRFRFQAFLTPPAGPSEPGGYDFRRTAWFAGLGAVGRIEGELHPLGPAAPAGALDSLFIWLDNLRASVAGALRARMPQAEGAFAAAILVGDRAAIPPRALDDLRAANLAHLLAISGLHMALVTGLVFAAARILMALAPPLALRCSGKKVAAAAALAAGVAYLALSGASVATQRAFIMAAVALTAILLDRPAVTLRALALAAMIVLVLRPESLVEPGFQMSFAATAALVAVYGDMRDRWRWAGRGAGPFGRAALYLGALALTSLVAGAATAPFAAHHFNRVSSYGLIANIAAAPAMGLWVMPSALLAAVAAPFGAEGWALDLMAWGVTAILSVAHWVAELPDSTRMAAEAPRGAFAALVIGGLLLVLGGRWGRAAGVGAALVAGALWWGGGRPDVLIAERGRLIGALGAEGRALAGAGGRADFIASTWLRRDGDAARPREASDRPGLSSGDGWAHAALDHGWRLEAELKRADQARLEALCQTRVILLAPRNWRPPAGPCLFIGPVAVNSGPLAVTVADSDVAALTTVPDRAGRRFWTEGAAGLQAQ